MYVQIFFSVKILRSSHWPLNYLAFLMHPTEYSDFLKQPEIQLKRESQMCLISCTPLSTTFLESTRIKRALPYASFSLMTQDTKNNGCCLPSRGLNSIKGNRWTIKMCTNLPNTSLEKGVYQEQPKEVSERYQRQRLKKASRNHQQIFTVWSAVYQYWGYNGIKIRTLPSRSSRVNGWRGKVP